MQDYLEKLTEQIGKMLTYGAQQAGVALGHLWIVLVRQQITLGAIWCFYGVVLLVVSIVSVRLIRSISKRDIDEWDKAALCAFLGVMAFASALNGAMMLVAWLPHLLNPEYYALQEAVQILKGVKQ